MVADAIQNYNHSAILGDPVSVSMILGVLGWVVAMVAAAVAFRRAGAGWPLTVLVGASSIFAIHPPPIGPIGLACFAAAVLLSERATTRELRARDRRAPEAVPAA